MTGCFHTVPFFVFLRDRIPISGQKFTQMEDYIAARYGQLRIIKCKQEFEWNFWDGSLKEADTAGIHSPFFFLLLGGQTQWLELQPPSCNIEAYPAKHKDIGSLDP